MQSLLCLNMFVAIDKKTLGNQYTISDRHRDAIKHLGLPPADVLCEGLAIISQFPEQMVAEDIGIDEKRVNFRFYHLSEAAERTIQRLTPILGIRSPSAIVRNAIEAVIDRRNLEQFKKPSSWQSRLLIASVAGSRGKNPEAKLPHSYKVKSYSIPAWLWNLLRERGSNDISLSRTRKVSKFVRNALDLCTNVVPLSPSEMEDHKRVITVSLYDRHLEKLSEWQQSNPEFDTESHVFSAVLKQAVIGN